MTFVGQTWNSWGFSAGKMISLRNACLTWACPTTSSQLTLLGVLIWLHMDRTSSMSSVLVYCLMIAGSCPSGPAVPNQRIIVRSSINCSKLHLLNDIQNAHKSAHSWPVHLFLACRWIPSTKEMLSKAAGQRRPTIHNQCIRLMSKMVAELWCDAKQYKQTTASMEMLMCEMWFLCSKTDAC